MRILHIIGTLNPASGGPAAAVCAVIESSPSEFVHEVVTLDDHASSFLTERDLTVHALGPTGSIYGYNRQLIPWLRAHRSRFDAVIVGSGANSKNSTPYGGVKEVRVASFSSFLQIEG